MKMHYVSILLVGFCALPGITLSNNLNEFSAGERIVAADINDNFRILKERLNEVELNVVMLLVADNWACNDSAGQTMSARFGRDSTTSNDGAIQPWGDLWRVDSREVVILSSAGTGEEVNQLSISIDQAAPYKLKITETQAGGSVWNCISD
ncbi:Uncharacterised protein [BD1-7 clade bacterium]|uniref:Uncharacterized protein n=1 Tax=BD1-7 clade bacterium TaxID=2029982 RepID=A0A5S9PGV8_9GAMM|nr:Uncharacterised protein [BD1-7 clade bacterium]